MSIASHGVGAQEPRQRSRARRLPIVTQLALSVSLLLLPCPASAEWEVVDVAPWRSANFWALYQGCHRMVEDNPCARFKRIFNWRERQIECWSSTEAADGQICPGDDNRCREPSLCEAGRCEPGPPVNCDDKDPCTGEYCDRAYGCVSWPQHRARCDDGDRCTVDDRCQPGGCAGAPRDCDDGDPCTVDACEPANAGATGCRHRFADMPCDDGDPCTREDACRQGICRGSPMTCDDDDPCTVDGACVAGRCPPPEPRECPDDGNPCTRETCDPDAGCMSAYRAEACRGAGACRGDEDCDDGDECTADHCDSVRGCQHEPRCRAAGRCFVPICRQGSCRFRWPACGDGWCSDDCQWLPQVEESPSSCPEDCAWAVCGDGVCDASGGEDERSCAADCGRCGDGRCVSPETTTNCPADCCRVPSGERAGEWIEGSCGDGTCRGPQCGETAASCPEDCGLDLSDDVCGRGEDPINSPADCRPMACGDGVCEDYERLSGRCDAADLLHDCPRCGDCTCSGDEDVASCPLDCSDCGDGWCSPCEGDAGSCPRDCTADPCNGIDDDRDGLTDEAGCHDGNPCTVDRCVRRGPNDAICDFRPHSLPPGAVIACDDGDPCTIGDRCQGGRCVAGTLSAECCQFDVDCDDGEECTRDDCLPDGSCRHWPRAGFQCGLGEACFYPGRCDEEGRCNGAQPRCDDDQPCTEDTCAPDGTCSHRRLTGEHRCDDGNACTTGDRCEAGRCVGTPRDCRAELEGQAAPPDGHLRFACDRVAGCVSYVVSDDGRCAPGHCGNGSCDAPCGETVDSCAADCSVCGDRVVAWRETRALLSDGTTPNPHYCLPDICATCYGNDCERVSLGCGDGFCTGWRCGETPQTCPDDCKAPCGNGFCEQGEDQQSCPVDCAHKVCGNGICEEVVIDGVRYAEIDTCPQDCALAICGDCLCDVGAQEHDRNRCDIDCGTLCGDGTCSPCGDRPENAANCPQDCR